MKITGENKLELNANRRSPRKKKRLKSKEEGNKTKGLSQRKVKSKKKIKVRRGANKTRSGAVGYRAGVKSCN